MSDVYIYNGSHATVEAIVAAVLRGVVVRVHHRIVEGAS